MTTLPFPPVVLDSTSDSVIFASGSTIHVHSSSSSSSLSTIANPTPKLNAFSLIRFIAISPSKKYIAALTDDKSLRIYTLNPLALQSTRQITKKCSEVSFTSNDDIIISDRVGDVYLYPLVSRSIPEDSRPTTTELNSDPSKNPDADLLAGHVSVITSHVVSQDGKYLITADRDEHIRVSRYPNSYVIERYLFGSNGFVSALHIPVNRPEVLVTGGGEDSLRIWDWQRGKQLGSVSILGAILPHRRARSTMRKTRRVTKKQKVDEDAPASFYDTPDGWLLPSGQGVLVKKIKSLVIGDETVIVFFSEGAAAIHAFTLDPTGSPKLQTLPLDFPVLDFTSVPDQPDQLLLSLDKTWGTIKRNQIADERNTPPSSLAEDQVQDIQQPFIVVQIASGGELNDITSTSTSLLHPLHTLLSSPSLQAPINIISALPLYPDLSLFPRWPGMEEDDELAGTNEPTGESAAPASEVGTSAAGGNKQWTWEELETLGIRQLGRLKAQGVDIGDLLTRRKKEGKEKKKAERSDQRFKKRDVGGEVKDQKNGDGVKEAAV